MQISDLVQTLRIDLGDADQAQFTDDTLTRCILRALAPVNRDLGITMRVTDGAVLPEPTGEIAEVIVLLGQIHACQVKRASTAGNFAFTSGDKRIDKSSQAKNWAELETTLQQRYDQRVLEIHPGMETGIDGYLLQPPRITPVPYEQGIDLEMGSGI